MISCHLNWMCIFFYNVTTVNIMRKLKVKIFKMFEIFNYCLLLWRHCVILCFLIFNRCNCCAWVQFYCSILAAFLKHLLQTKTCKTQLLFFDNAVSHSIERFMQYVLWAIRKNVMSKIIAQLEKSVGKKVF